VSWRDTVANRLAPPPTLDRGRAGLTLVTATYGVVLGSIFTATAHGVHQINGPGRSQLLLAAAVVIFSWLGFYNNRMSYPIWKARFINVPFLQYVVTVSLAGLYYLIVSTAELPGGTAALKDPVSKLPAGTAITLAQVNGHASIRPETTLLLLIFVMYLVWDVLELVVLCSAAKAQRRFGGALVTALAAEQATAQRLSNQERDRVAATLSKALETGSSSVEIVAANVEHAITCVDRPTHEAIATKIRTEVGPLLGTQPPLSDSDIDAAIVLQLEKLDPTTPAITNTDATWNQSSLVELVARTADLRGAQCKRMLWTLAFAGALVLVRCWAWHAGRQSPSQVVRFDLCCVAGLFAYRFLQGLVRRDNISDWATG
jgi:hypothetical protein